MENGINKKGFFDLKVEPYLRPISDIGIGFYNLDENTATLRFQLSNNAGSLLISENNLSVYGYFESSNGSVSDVIDLKIVDEMNGVVEVTLDQNFLHASTSTKVTGQLYIGVRNVDGKPEYNEVAVLGEFTFEVADSLINKVSSFTKIEYIRMFSQLKAKIEQDVVDIQEAIKNGADYVAEMKTVKTQAINQINQTVTEGKAYIDSVISQSEINFNETVTNVISEIKTTKDNTISTMNNKASEKVSEVENISNDVIKHVDDKLTEFNTGIEENSFIQPTDLENKLNELEWQKYRLVQDNGQLQIISLADDVEKLHNLPTGFYYTTTTPIVGIGATSTAGFLEVLERNGGILKRITFRPYNSKQVWVKRFYNTWTDWERVDITQTDTGWIPFQLINGALSNTAYKNTGDGGFDCAYRTITNGSETKKLLRLNGSNLTHNSVIAQLPSNFCKNAQSFPIRVPTGTTWFGAFIVIRPSGEVRFLINGEYSNWNDTGYTYGQFEWTD
ncbi:BppU family phage baseplate upper protein [Mammaliicoccus sciuri]|uniref:BppU family phage baseplate upper protein n=1 Tax=Mammaliicoccus sciuri TaxID=1296 RepID=UPI0034DD90E9